MDKTAPFLMLVEDDPSHAQLTLRTLRESRLVNEVRHLHDGAQAMDFLQQRGVYYDATQFPRPGLLLLDLRLPKLSGLEVLCEIRNTDKLEQLPVIIPTTSSAETDEARAFQLQASGYLVKPLDISEFRQLTCDLKLHWLVWDDDNSGKN